MELKVKEVTKAMILDEAWQYAEINSKNESEQERLFVQVLREAIDHVKSKEHVVKN